MEEMVKTFVDEVLVDAVEEMGAGIVPLTSVSADDVAAAVIRSVVSSAAETLARSGGLGGLGTSKECYNVGDRGREEGEDFGVLVKSFVNGVLDGAVERSWREAATAVEGPGGDGGGGGGVGGGSRYAGIVLGVGSVDDG